MRYVLIVMLVSIRAAVAVAQPAQVIPFPQPQAAGNEQAGHIGIWAAPGKLGDTGNATAPANFTVTGNLNVLGTSNAIPGYVKGPTPTQVNELASWANTTGNLLRQGMAQVTDSHTAAMAVTGATMTGRTSAAVSADQILAYDFCTGPCLPLPAMGGGNYDGVRGIGILNSGSTVPIVGGVSGYVISNEAYSGCCPTTVALFGVGVAAVYGSAAWGLNARAGDHQYRQAQSGNGGRLIIGAEIDVDASYPDTQVTGLQVGGNSVVQPAHSTAMAVVPQDYSAPVPGSIAKWETAYYSYPGAAMHFANIGVRDLQATDSNGQDILIAAKVAGSTFLGALWFGLAPPPNFGSTASPSFNLNYPLQIYNGGLTVHHATNTNLETGGPIDFSTGTSINSRNDNRSALQPFEILAAQILLNSGALYVNNGSTGIVLAVTCTAAPSSSFATVNGIVTHC